jgi:hypothetical protein
MAATWARPLPSQAAAGLGPGPGLLRGLDPPRLGAAGQGPGPGPVRDLGPRGPVVPRPSQAPYGSGTRGVGGAPLLGDAAPFWGTQKGGSIWGQGPPPLPHELAQFLNPLGGSPQPP